VNSQNTDNIPARALDEAAGWIARLRSDSVSEQDQQGFALWLAADACHRRAMDSMLDMWDDLAVVKVLPWRDHRRDTSRRNWIAGGLALAASLTLAILLTPQLNFSQQQQLYKTRIGEQMSVELADGSHVTLNTDSRLQVELGAESRQLILTRGEAFFQVAHDQQRPFVVQAGDTQVVALGTAFNIYLHDDASHITVTEGVVRVTELNTPASRAADSALLYIDQTIAGDSGGLSQPAIADSSSILAWRDGNIVAEGMTLLTLVRELSRYHTQQILIPDPEVGQLTVSGVFRLQDPDTILRALEHTLAVRSVRLDDGTVQLIRAPL